MARQISVIEQQILDSVAADDTLKNNLTSKSKRAIFRLWAFIVATAQAVHEQLWDAYRIEIEGKIAAAAPGTAAWIQDKVFKFQYSTTAPQVVQLIDLAPRYPVNDPSLRIVTRCSVTTDISNNVTVKVAKSNPPTALDSLQQAALQSYLDLLNPAGITCNVISLLADRIFVKAQVFYNGLFSSVIKTNVILAIDNYLASIPFNGRVKVSDLEGAILAVDGVEDVVLEQVIARPEAVAFGGGTALVNNNTLASRFWPTVAGYAISEDTVGQTLADSLTLISV